MLDNGYSLSKVELYNWGNFHGLQKFSFRDDCDYGPMFSPPPATAILGVNGSGKSTLIDGLMMVLLPFENSLKLGVTNDAETGGAGGRTIRDYVLGKFSSTGEGAPDTALDEVYGRQNGSSVFLLQFKHNKYKDRTITLGRIWWFQNYKVSETQLAFIHYDSICITDLVANNQLPKNPKTFKEFMKEKHNRVQIFETMQSYFLALSNCLGQISRDDLKILNRAFYVKSISQIDNFIRENMLIEQESPHLYRLLENVRNGQEIAYAIDKCNAKIAQIEKILKSLDKLLEIRLSKSQLEKKRRLLIVYSDWVEIERLKNQIKEAYDKISRLNLNLPNIQSELNAHQTELTQVQTQISQDNLTIRIQQLEVDLKYLEEKLKVQKQIFAEFEKKVKQTELTGPKSNDDWYDFLDQISEKKIFLKNKIKANSEKMEQIRSLLFNLQNEGHTARNELEHLAKTRTLLPKDLYQIKEDALVELKIPPNNLFFVGELVQVKKEFQKNRRAIESALMPISRHLVCHPDHLNSLTKWINNNGLKVDIVAKRITNEELKCEESLKTILNEVPRELDDILGMIEILPENQNSFYFYLWRWLSDAFDFKLIELEKFKGAKGKVVTIEGLVKTDIRTMRKPKQHFSFSLGWDNQELIHELTKKLVATHEQISLNNNELSLLTDNNTRSEELCFFLDQLKDISDIDFLNWSQTTEQLNFKKDEKETLLKKNPNFNELKRKASDLQNLVQADMRRLSDCEIQIKSNQDLVVKIERLLPSSETQLKSSPFYSQMVNELGIEALLIQALNDLDTQLTSKKLTRISYEAQLDSEISQFDIQQNRLISIATSDLGLFKREFGDPNLPYDMNLAPDIQIFSTQWRDCLDRLVKTELPVAQDKWKKFFDQVLLDSVKDSINEIKGKIHEIQQNIDSINNVLKLTDFENLPTEKRYLKIDIQSTQDDRIRVFRRRMTDVEKILGPQIRAQIESHSKEIMETLMKFVEELQKDPHYRQFVTDVRNHFQFKVHSLRRTTETTDPIVETFTGARKDAKSSAQTTQLAYALLASCLAYRFKINDPVLGKDTPRLLILDEFGGKFDNEKPKDILKLLDQMGFQSILVSPMSKADLLAEYVSQLILVHKVSASKSKAMSFSIQSKEDYDRLTFERRSAVINENKANPMSEVTD